MSGPTLDYMREKLKEWHPNWNVDRFSSPQVAAMYRKEQQKIIQSMMVDIYGVNPVPDRNVEKSDHQVTFD